MRYSRAVSRICVLLGVFVGGLACDGANRKSSAPIRIGGVYALTGGAASFGVWARNGAELAVEEINSSGGIKGVRLEHIVEDTQSEPKNAVSAFSKLISSSRIDAAVGFVMSDEALACAPIAERTKTVMITPVAGAESLREAGKYVFRTRESGVYQARATAEYAVKKLNIRQASVFYENAGNSIAYRDGFVRRFAELGGTILEELDYNEGELDFRPFLLRLKKSRVPAIYAPGISTKIGSLLSQAQEIKLGVQWLSSAGIEDPKLFELAGEAAEGVVFATSQFSLDAEEGRTKAFVSSYRRRFGSDPSVYAANAFDAVGLLAESFRAGKKRAGELASNLGQAKAFPGASGSITFDADGEVCKPIVIKTIQGRKFVPGPGMFPQECERG